MLSEQLRISLMDKIRNNPKEAMADLEKEPQVLEFLLNSDKRADMKKREKIKYVNMTQAMQQQLEQKSKELKTTQGLLIGAGVLLLLSLLSE